MIMKWTEELDSLLIQWDGLKNKPRAYYIEWNKSERERQILHIKTHMWNLESWHWWSYMQGRKGDTDIKNRLLDSVGEGEGGMIWENSIETCTLPYVKQIVSRGLIYDTGHPKPVLCDSPEGWSGERFQRKVQEGGDTCMSVADSYWCMAKSSQYGKVITLQSI